jgi:trans-aconitate 2-methyltransferase
VRWNPTQYARYSAERSRPFFDLIAQIRSTSPGEVADIGCGSGKLTVALAERWPESTVRGVDSSPEMIERAPLLAGVTFSVGAAQDFAATGIDVLVSNAMLQWVPHHDQLLVGWARQLNDGGWLAFQVPDNFGAPSHRLMRDLAASAKWRDRLDGVLRGRDSVAEPDAYLELLSGEGMTVDVWQTEYLHVLQGEDPVLDWLGGTGLRPVLAALPDEEADDFSAEFARLLREAYPPRSFGTVLAFRRTFVVAHKS